MIDTERGLTDVARLCDELLRERAEGLHDAAQNAKSRLAERELAMARLREQVKALKSSLSRPPAPVAAPAAVPEKEAAMDSARFTTASLPRTARVWKAVPYAAIVACALILDLGGARRAPATAREFSGRAQPAPVATRERAEAEGAPVAEDDDRSQEALLLVHEWKLPGDEKSLGERLGNELDLPGGRPAWSVERTGANGYRVTYQAAARDLPYSFDADIEARVVWPTPETQALLAPRYTAVFRDSAR